MNSAKVGAPIGEGREQKDAIDEEVGISFEHIPNIRFISIHWFYFHSLDCDCYAPWIHHGVLERNTQIESTNSAMSIPRFAEPR